MDKATLASIIYGKPGIFVILCESDVLDIRYVVHIVREWGNRIIWVQTVMECADRDEALDSFDKVRFSY